MSMHMHHTPSERTSITLPADLMRRLIAAARGSGRSASAVVRDALEAYFSQTSVDLPSFAGVGDSGTTDTSKRAEKIIAASFRRKKSR